jgi:hypothetical protein
MSDVTPAQKLDQALHDPDAKSGQEAVDYLLIADPPDPLWVSALRGRIMAAMASAASLAASGAMLYQSVKTIATSPTQVGMAGAVADIAQQAVSLVDAGLALTAAAASLIALIASLNSKAREWLRTQMGGHV